MPRRAKQRSDRAPVSDARPVAAPPPDPEPPADEGQLVLFDPRPDRRRKEWRR